MTKRYFEQGVVQGGEALYCGKDALGSVRQVVDANAIVRARYDYDAYGNRTRTSGDLDVDMGYAGLFRHKASGLDLAVYRAYDAQRGRWMSRDPILEVGGSNLYGYVGGNPLAAADFTGLAACVVDFPNMPIDTGLGFSSTSLGGHSGVLGYGNDGSTRYYEYGRYPPNSSGVFGERLPSNDGNYRRLAVPDLKIGPNGEPTSASLDALKSALSRNAGKGTQASLTCTKDADEKKIYDYAEQLAGNKDRRPCSWAPWSSNQCRTFARDALGAGR